MSLNFVLIATAIFSLSRSWGSTSHFVIAAIAQKRLLKCYPEIFDKAVEILNFLKDFTNSGEYPFLDAAMFADDIKTADWKTFSPNHFYHQNFGYVKGNLQINEAKNQDGNILTGLVQSLKTLKGGTSPKVDTRLSMSLELRMLMHYVGDIHQPLHTISRITKNHLEGDFGGTLFKISNTDSRSLHEYWDKYFDHKDWKFVFAPIGDNDYKFIIGQASLLMKEHPYSTLQAQLKKNSSFKDWLDESQDIAIRYVYDKIIEYKQPTPEYDKLNWPILERQLVLAGYRLADVLINA